jgi:hypothetical protein
VNTGESPGPEPPATRAPGQAALVAAAVILAALVVVTLLGQAAVLPQSEAAALNAAFLGVSGLVAGLVGAGQRRRQRWPGATAAYRLAMWCFFLAALHAVKYHVAADREAEEDRIRRASQRFEEMQRLQEQQKGGDTAPEHKP